MRPLWRSSGRLVPAAVVGGARLASDSGCGKRKLAFEAKFFAVPRNAGLHTMRSAYFQPVELRRVLSRSMFMMMPTHIMIVIIDDPP